MFVPKLPSAALRSLAEAAAPGCRIDTIGIRPGEKLHEVLVSQDEARNTLEFDDMFVVKPAPRWLFGADPWTGGASLPEGFTYASDNNPEALTTEEIRGMVEDTATTGLPRDSRPTPVTT